METSGNGPGPAPVAGQLRKSTRSHSCTASLRSKSNTADAESEPPQKVRVIEDTAEKPPDSVSVADSNASDSASDKENVSIKGNGRPSEENHDAEPSSGFEEGVDESFENETSDGDESSSTPEDQFEVEKILDYAKDAKKDGHLYHVKWKDWEDAHNTWEPPENLVQCEDALIAFFLERRAQVDDILAKSEYFESADGKRRRKGPPLPHLPPDPRPVAMIAEEFYAKNHSPSETEIKKCEAEWQQKWEKEQKLKAKSKGKTTQTSSFVWQRQKIIRVLQEGINGKLNAEETVTLRKQLIFYECERKKTLATEALKQWEDEINEISKGNPVIKVENNVDLEGAPLGFVYIDDYVPGPGIKIPDDPPVGCACEGNCYENRNECCASQSGFPFAYTPYGKLKVPVGTAIYECNKKCPCGPDCPNRVVQHGSTTLRLSIFRTATGMGWGVKTLKNIKRGQFVSLYVGEVIRTEEAERRGRDYDAEGCTYLFDLDFNEGDTCPYTVDAASYGNIAHFINHSCDPNLAVFSVWINCLDPNLPKLALFAIKDIGHGEELFFDYKNDVNKDAAAKGQTQGVDAASPSKMGSPSKGAGPSGSNASPSKVASPQAGTSQKSQTERKRKECLCGAANCRKFLF